MTDLSKREHMALEMWRTLYCEDCANRRAVLSHPIAESLHPATPGDFARATMQHVNSLLAELERGQSP